MNIRRKTIAVICLTIISLTAVLYITSRVIILESFLKLENLMTSSNAQRALNALEDQIAQIGAVNSDYAKWDDTYEFINDSNEDYIKNNLVDQSFINTSIHVMIFADTRGHIVYKKAYDYYDKKSISVPESLISVISPDSPLFAGNGPDESITGIVVFSETIMLITAHPILTSEGDGPSRGLLIMGRFLDDREMKNISDITRLTVSIHPFKDPYPPSDLIKAHAYLSADHPVFISSIGDKTVAGYTLINDIFDRPALILKIEAPREIYATGKNAVVFFLVFLIAVCLVLGVVMILFLEKLVLFPLWFLDKNVKQIGKHANFSVRLPVAGKNEFANLSDTINNMLESLQKSDANYRALFENMSEGFSYGKLVFDEKNKSSDFIFLEVNDEFEKLAGTNRENIIGNKASRILPEVFKLESGCIENIENAVACRENFSEEIFFTDQEKWYSLSAFSPQNGYISILYFDITQRKRAEETIRKQAYTDSLTGLHNRAYFDLAMSQFNGDPSRSFPLSIISIDLDGLKIINDTFGHKVGDQLLKHSAGIIEKAFENADLVARIGGDEFCVIVANTEPSDIQQSKEKLLQLIDSYNHDNPLVHLSMSMGIATITNGDEDVYSAFQQADDNMYQYKLSQSGSLKSKVIDILLTALSERDYVAQGHVERLVKMSGLMAEKVNLSDTEKRNLILLAKVHDLGKIGVPDEILFKPGKLSFEEYEKMKQHVLIGHNIANRSKELSHIANLIRHHHEFWNGKGYPDGLKEMGIPIECRILAIIDSYDAMTSKRPYHDGISSAQAVEELKRCSGTQFDPALTSRFIEIMNFDNPETEKNEHGAE